MYAILYNDSWFSTEMDEDQAIEIVELAYEQIGGKWTITVYDPRTRKLYETIYAIAPR